MVGSEMVRLIIAWCAYVSRVLLCVPAHMYIVYSIYECMCMSVAHNVIICSCIMCYVPFVFVIVKAQCTAPNACSNY